MCDFQNAFDPVNHRFQNRFHLLSLGNGRGICSTVSKLGGLSVKTGLKTMSGINRLKFCLTLVTRVHLAYRRPDPSA